MRNPFLILHKSSLTRNTNTSKAWAFVAFLPSPNSAAVSTVTEEDGEDVEDDHYNDDDNT